MLAICNTNGSTIPRESDGVIYTHAGPEIGVASTKGFLTQLVACYLLALYLAQVKGTRYGDEIAQVLRPARADARPHPAVLARTSEVYALARDHVGSRSVLFLGRHAGYPVALEGALKLKEIAYLHAEGFAAGELKHGPIALVEEGLPVLCVVPPRGRDQLHEKMISGIQEVRARGARTICLAEEGDDADHAVRRRADPAAAGAGAAAAAGRRRAAAAVRVRAGHPARPRRRPAPQPRQVRHGRVGRETACRRASASTSSTSTASWQSLERTPGLRDAAVHRRRGGRGRRPRWPRGSPPRRRSPRRSARPAGMAWHDAEVVSEETGRPRFEIRGTVAARAEALGVAPRPPLALPRRRHRLGRRGAGELSACCGPTLVEQVRARRGGR